MKHGRRTLRKRTAGLTARGAWMMRKGDRLSVAAARALRQVQLPL